MSYFFIFTWAIRLTSCFVYRGSFNKIEPEDVIAMEDLITIPLIRGSMEDQGIDPTNNERTSVINQTAPPDAGFWYIFAEIVRWSKLTKLKDKEFTLTDSLVRQLRQHAHPEENRDHAELLRRLMCIAQSDSNHKTRHLPESASELAQVLDGDPKLIKLMAIAGLTPDAVIEMNTPHQHPVPQPRVPSEQAVGSIDAETWAALRQTWAALRKGMQGGFWGIFDSRCEHGRERYRCKECDGSAFCEHGRRRSDCKECDGSQMCEHGRRRSTCTECGGSQICEHGRIRSQCKQCGGASICEHGRERCKCKECGGSQICEHGRRRTQCKECGGSQICEHGRVRSECKECGGGSICEHGRRRSLCKECSPHNFCTHGRRRYSCKECKK